MAFDRIKKTKSGSYKYRVESYWDSTLQAPRSRSVYLGKIDEATGELIQGKTIRRFGIHPDRVLDFGHVMVCRRLAEDAGILPALRASFGDEKAELLLLLATYLVCEESPLYIFERWQEGVYQAVGLEPRHCTSTAIWGFFRTWASPAVPDCASKKTLPRSTARTPVMPCWTRPAFPRIRSLTATPGMVTIAMTRGCPR